MTKKEVYQKYLNILLELIRKSYNDSGLRASGNFERELESVINGDNLRILGASYSNDLETGRTAGDFQRLNFQSHVRNIEDWIEVKNGLPREFKTNKQKFAFLIARKHFREGIRVPNRFNKGDVISKPLEEFERRYLEQMIEDLGGVFINELTGTITRILTAA